MANNRHSSGKHADKFKPNKFGAQSKAAKEDEFSRAMAEVERMAERAAKRVPEIEPDILKIFTDHNAPLTAEGRESEPVRMIRKNGEDVVFLSMSQADALLQASGPNFLSNLLKQSGLNTDQDSQSTTPRGRQPNYQSPTGNEGKPAGSDKRAGFTVIELMASMGTAAMLMSILIASALKATGSAREMQFKNNMKQVGLALHNFDSAHGHFPFAVSHKKNAEGVMVPTTWVKDLLPYLDQQNAGVQYDDTNLPEHQAQHIKELLLPVLQHPSYPENPGETHIAAVSNIGGMASDPAVINSEGLTGLKQYIHKGSYYDTSDNFNVAMPPQYTQNPTNNKITEHQEKGFRDLLDGSDNTVVMAQHTPAEDNRDPWLNNPATGLGETHQTGNMWDPDVGGAHVGARLGTEGPKGTNYVHAHIGPVGNSEQGIETITVLYASGAVANQRVTRHDDVSTQHFVNMVNVSNGDIGDNLTIGR